MEEKLFSKKILYMYNTLDISDKEFIKLFSKEDDNYKSRHITIVKNWLTKGIDKVKGFYFEDYPVSELLIKDKPAFTKELFTNKGFEEFKIAIDTYIEYSNKNNQEFSYKYLFTFDKNLQDIVYFEFIKIDKESEIKYSIILSPPKYYKKDCVEDYKGYLSIYENYYYLSVENDFEIMNFYFAFNNKGINSNNKLYGIFLGRSYKNGLPFAKKFLLTKENLNKKDKNRLYLNANETDQITLNSNTYYLNNDIKIDYFKKLNHKLKDISNYIDKSKKIFEEEKIEDIYLKIFEENIQNLGNIAKKISKDQDFYIFKRNLAIKTFLYQTYKQKNSCCIVYPLFDNGLTHFNKSDDNCKKFLEFQLNLVEKKFKLTRIYVVKKYFEVTEYFKEEVEKLISSGAKVFFVSKEDIDLLKINSYDFLLNEKKDIAVYQNGRDKTHTYHITKNRNKIDEMFFDYKHIYEKSFSFNKLLEYEEEQKHNEILEKLIGQWYYYSYRSTKKNILVVGDAYLNIKKDATLTYFQKNMDDGKNTLNRIGEVDTTYNPNQTYLRLTNIESKHLAIIIINNKNLYKNIFKVSMLNKKYAKEEEVAFLGIFSRLKLKEKVIRDTLGEARETMLLESSDLDGRINDLYIKMKQLSNSNSDIL